MKSNDTRPKNQETMTTRPTTHKCKCDLIEWNYESDNFHVTSPSGTLKSVWIHCKEISELDETEKEMWLNLLTKAREARQERQDWQAANRPPQKKKKLSRLA